MLNTQEMKDRDDNEMVCSHIPEKQMFLVLVFNRTDKIPEPKLVSGLDYIECGIKFVLIDSKCTIKDRSLTQKVINAINEFK